MLMAHIANNNSNDLLTAISTDGGIHWTGSRPVSGQTSKSAPALAGPTPNSDIPDNVLLAYVANNDTNDPTRLS